jgi:hypothetical protein
MRIFVFFVCLTCFVFASGQESGGRRWSFELHGGIVTNLRLPLVIKQDGYPDIRIERAHFRSEPLISPFYWDWRFSRWRGNKSLEFEAIHHKLYLVNKPPEVERFGISHGFNMLFLNYGCEAGKFIFRAGLGSVLMHPESTVRGKKWPEDSSFDADGYYLRGVAVNLGFAKQFRFGKYFFINAEGKITAGTANVPILKGTARVQNVAFHFILGPGFNWAVKD